MATYRHWTRKEEQDAVTMRQDGMKLREIAVELGRTRKAIMSRLLQLRVLKPDELKNYWYHVFRRPHSIKQLIAEHGLSRSCINQLKHRLKQAGMKTVKAYRGRYNKGDCSVITKRV